MKEPAPPMLSLRLVRPPSGVEKLMDSRCQATIGRVFNPKHGARRLRKAVQSWWLGRRPFVRGVTMNPVDHPHRGDPCVFLVPLARTKFSHVHFVITTVIFDAKDQKLCANSYWISVVLNSDGYSFKSSGSTTRFSTRWKFSGFRGRPMWGTFWVWDARLTSVFILFLIYLGALRFQKLPVESASISIRAGPIDIPIIKSSVNWWNTPHQLGSISRSGTSIYVPMLIPILFNFANFPFSTHIFFVLETRLLIPSFLESPLTDEIKAREGIPKRSSLAVSFCIHG
ncbi:hypothetical protein SO802_031302 [Lithocarpus litseifolius]|uniref:Large ribosomal subunit protein uL2 C-terminal domain-containing protein n=1 Tax=Lithocarpus litseifolius TaxID=425828 RepID=A0AAW2BLY6_9ROSI